MIDSETNYIEIGAKPFSDVLWEVVDHTTEDIGIGTITVTTASDGTESDSLITLKWLQGSDEITVEEVDGNLKENVGLDDITALT